jgi:hypothetical protein
MIVAGGVIKFHVLPARVESNNCPTGQQHD